MATQAASPAPTQKMTLAQQNQMATQYLLKNGLNRIQIVQSPQTIYPASQPQLSFNPINVGLVKRFIVMVSATIANTGSTVIALNDMGLSNLISNFQYIDLNNFLRINTTGLHLSLLANAKRRMNFAGTLQMNTATGNNLSQVFNTPPAYWPVLIAPQSIDAGSSATVQTYYEVPLAYSNTDFRGAILANVLQAIQQLIITPNPTPVTASPADDTFSVYSGATGSAGNITAMTVTVYQEYLDQIENAQGMPIVPTAALSQAYMLMNSPFQGISAGQDYPVSYANQRKFLSTFFVYNSTGAAGGRSLGTDINYIGQQVANAMYVYKFDPYTATMLSRNELREDLPAGTYYISSRQKSINTTQFGNVQLVVNPIVGSASSKLQVMWEMMADLNTLTSAPGLNING